MDERVLEPGWGGIITLDEAEFIQSRIKADPVIRRRWGYGYQRKTYPLRDIAAKAFPQNPQEGRRQMGNLIEQRANAAKRGNGE